MTVRFGAELIPGTEPPGTELSVTPKLPATLCSLGSLGSAGYRHPDRDRRSANVLRRRRRRRIIYDARRSSSPISNLEAFEKHEENQPGARENSNLDLKALCNQSLSAVGLLSYPESYPRQSRAAMGPLGIGWARMSHLVTLGT